MNPKTTFTITRERWSTKYANYVGYFAQEEWNDGRKMHKPARCFASFWQALFYAMDKVDQDLDRITYKKVEV